jgi:hypothetical protein
MQFASFTSVWPGWMDWENEGVLAKVKQAAKDSLIKRDVDDDFIT